MSAFLGDNFALTTPLARTLYHRWAAQEPIFDYHCHLPVRDIAENRQFDNLSRIWLAGDHYKWRGMRSNGVGERFCTGDATDQEKFNAWAATVPCTVGNPLFVWTHLELRRHFGITELLNPSSAARIYDHCNALLRTPEYSARSLMKRAGVRAVCTTDDPIDDLAWHNKIRADGFEVRVLPTFRPDKAMAFENLVACNAYLDSLAAVTGIDINSYNALLEAIDKRHAFFHANGCRLSDHGLESMPFCDSTQAQLAAAFDRARRGIELDPQSVATLKGALLVEFARMDHSRGWTQQLHIGALRNTNSRRFAALGPDTGFDAIADFTLARPLAAFLDALDRDDRLPRTILYTLNPVHNELIATMLGNFQGGEVAGKMQFGSGWWFMDQRDGMEKQMTALANLGLLSRFVGMLTDSRSFLSYPRHEYFRRILCKLLGEWAELGEIPADEQLLGPMVKAISFGNAERYFDIPVA